MPALLSGAHEGNSTPDHDTDPAVMDSTEQGEGAGGGGGERRAAIISNTVCEDELSRLSCLAIPHTDVPPMEYHPRPSQ